MSEFLLDDFNDWVRGVGWAVAISLEVEVALIVRPTGPRMCQEGAESNPGPQRFFFLPLDRFWRNERHL